MNGFFITFEGGEGSGKSTQIARLVAYLRGTGRTVVTTREPGGSEGAEAIRHVILSGAAAKLGDDMEAILFAAARADHVATLIRPALDAGSLVVCDRFHDSTRVYQGLAGVDRALLIELEAEALQGTVPDLTIVLDVPASVGLERAAARRGGSAADRFEREGIEVHEARRSAFLALAEREPQRCVVLDGSLAVEDVAEKIVAIVEARLKDRPIESSSLSLDVDAGLFSS